MNYFNYLPFGGGDNLFWDEFYGLSHSNCFIRLSRRYWIMDAIDRYAKERGMNVLGRVDAEVAHFYHGTAKGRSHAQRHFLALT